MKTIAPSEGEAMRELARSLRCRRIMVDGSNGNVYDVADEECEQAAEIIERAAAQSSSGVREEVILECELAARGRAYKEPLNGRDGHNWSRDDDYGRGRHAAADAVRALSPDTPREGER